MTKRSFKKYAITFSGIIISGYIFLYACAGGDENWFGYSNFTPETFVEKSYGPLFFDDNQSFYYIGHDDNYDDRFNKMIVDEWFIYLDKKISKENLTYFLTGSCKQDINDLFNYAKNKKSNKGFQQWGKIINLNDPKFNAFIGFMFDASKVNQISTRGVDYDPWNYDEKPKAKKKSSPKLFDELKLKYKTTSDPFLKNRYWFQTMKAGFYGEEQNKAESFFNETKGLVPENTLFYRALSYIAGIHYKQKDYSTANYIYSQVFDNCPSLRMVTAYNFHPQNDKDWNEALAKAKSNKEKAALWAVLGFYADPERSVSEIFALEPASPHIDYLVTRMVNQYELKIQGSYWEPDEEKIESVSQFRNSQRSKINLGVIDRISAMALSDKTHNPFLMNLAAAYLNTLSGNYTKANDFFLRAKQHTPNTRLAQDQLRILQFVNMLSSMDKIDSENENKILADLNWLYIQLPADSTLDKQSADEDQTIDPYAEYPEYKPFAFRYQRASDWSKKYISLLYKANGDEVMEEFFNESGTFYENEKRTAKMKAFMQKTKKSKFEILAETIYRIKLSDLLEYQAVVKTFGNDLDGAIELMQQAVVNNRIELLANPFNGKIKDCHDCDFIAPKKITYTQLDLLVKMKEMKEKIERGDDVYNNSLLLANGYYNITYFGNSRIFYEGAIIGEMASTPWVINAFFVKMLTSCDLAKSYYNKAFEAASNTEQKAKCMYMLAKCERNEYYNQNIYSRPDQWENQEKAADFISWNTFKRLKNEFSDTKYYREVINECGYFKRFVNGRN